ncbi:arrestin (or S-antigen), N-terminal domain protein [Aspergillus clavatus NRRL 1]|uniref:Arrestin (Or S-antigen), N-terminal domain protein n=1 Tax=Aspergillus clavatus (strain ATCC 1007 / CBS 513.65 / DSM 816 / NCTC 3887 / NRRL 1 / QM 1276 / 107) TaxID=344612 RepID=A1CUH8_ASPCL|nr:arrestin (or S-antigen), N-terminal domain protein [Aspergillus clavatus NRRL 1]EAW06965.1 arrestin (or S-antigen), N-terminal domain protein [Aspergillus clavatus NRRL 1]
MAASILTRGSSSLEAITGRSRPKIQIELAGETNGLVSSYTTKDHIEGTATITVDRDTRFEEVEITFEGTSRTAVERASFPGRTGAYQTFLKLRQPIEDAAYPTPRILESGRTYQFPFTFVVPERLLPQVCSHTKTNAHVERSHTQLPPTLGDPMLASNGKTLLDDMVPEMCQVSYLICVSIQRKPTSESGPLRKILASAGKKVRIVPTVEEEPPLNVHDEDLYYCTRKEKDVKRGFMRGKLGRLVIAASQPRPIQLIAPQCETKDSVGSVATVHLRFDPIGNEQPPQLGSVWSKLRVSTFYSSVPWEDYPSAMASTMWAQAGKGIFTETVPLSTLCVASAQWTKHSTAPGSTRRDSLESTSSSESLTGPSASFVGSTYYTASVVVPITIPATKAFVPTFHSCLISRIYTLDLSISYHTPNANILTPSTSLRLPLQVTSQSQAKARSKTSVHEITLEEVDAEFFSPRSVAPPSDAVDVASCGTRLPLPGSISIAPPEYSELRSSLAPGVAAG